VCNIIGQFSKRYPIGQNLHEEFSLNSEQKTTLMLTKTEFRVYAVAILTNDFEKNQDTDLYLVKVGLSRTTGSTRPKVVNNKIQNFLNNKYLKGHKTELLFEATLDPLDSRPLDEIEKITRRKIGFLIDIESIKKLKKIGLPVHTEWCLVPKNIIKELSNLEIQNFKDIGTIKSASFQIESSSIIFLENEITLRNDFVTVVTNEKVILHF
jgi:hypothetical protein